MSVAGKTAIVTGAARGIGQAICEAFAAEGARVVAADILACDDTLARVRGAGAEAVATETDVTHAASTEAMVHACVDAFGSPDILVNNAALYGGMSAGPFEEIDESEWDRMMAVNVKGVWQCCKAVMPAMKAQGHGKIVNISSSTIWAGDPYALHYVASKGAVYSLTRALARELAGTGINVNAVTPGHTMTEASKGLLDPETFERYRRQSLHRQIIKRSEEATDVCGTVLFLSSPASDFMTGQTLNVDGGRSHN